MQTADGDYWHDMAPLKSQIGNLLPKAKFYVPEYFNRATVFEYVVVQ